MKAQVTITRKDEGARSQIKTDSAEWNKDYASWDDALIEAEQGGLMNATESGAAKLLPPVFPYHTTSEIELAALGRLGFVEGKAGPPR